MARKWRTAEKIISKLRQADVLMAQGSVNIRVDLPIINGAVLGTIGGER